MTFSPLIDSISRSRRVPKRLADLPCGERDNMRNASRNRLAVSRMIWIFNAGIRKSGWERKSARGIYAESADVFPLFGKLRPAWRRKFPGS
jgi:hypothetical protein